jgi:adenylate cyclase
MKTKSPSDFESPQRSHKKSLVRESVQKGLSSLRIKTRVKYPIGYKLVVIISILLIASLGAVIFMVSGLSTQDAQRTAEDNNFTVNRRAGSQAESEFKAVHAAALLFIEIAERISANSLRDPETELFFFNQNPNIAAIGITRYDANNSARSVFIPNTQFIQSNNLNENDIEDYFAFSLQETAAEFTENFVSESDMQLVNASPAFNLFMTNVMFLREGMDGNETVQILFSPSELSESFGTGMNTSFLISGDGNLLLHPDTDFVLSGANFSSLPIVSIMQEEGDNNRQVSFSSDGEEYFGAYYRLDGMDAVVITTIPHSTVFEAVRNITIQNWLLAAAVLFIAILFIWFFSKTISSPVRILAFAALRIESGNFEIDIKPSTQDEIGLLTESFGKMTNALKSFGRFTNKEIALLAMRGEIKPGGLPKHATILFADIREFTKTSENFIHSFGENAANQTVLWLNDHFTRMISCIETTQGIVDKFIGDTVMAHWGTAISSGSREGDAFNAVKTALLMREALIAMNAKNVNDPAKPIIRIGCGINSGNVIAGQIGSEQRMEYTVIGDPVNVASRIEGLCKIFGVDILITEDTWRLVGDKFITDEMQHVTVKGKEKPIRSFAVINFRDAEHGPKTLEDVRALTGLRPQEQIEMNNGVKEINPHVEARHQHDVKHHITNDSEKSPSMTITSFETDAWIQGPCDDAIPVFFSWNRSRFEEDTHVIVQIAEDRDFKNIVEERDVSNDISVSIPMDIGLYWWRVYPVSSGSKIPINQNYPHGSLMVAAHAKEKKYKTQTH